MKEYKIIYRDGELYKIIDGINNEDSAYEVLAMVVKAGYKDSRIEECTPSEIEKTMNEAIEYLKSWDCKPTKENIKNTLKRWIDCAYSHVGNIAHERAMDMGVKDETGISWIEQDLLTFQQIRRYQECLKLLEN